MTRTAFARRRAALLAMIAVAFFVLGAAGCGTSTYARKTREDRELSATVREALLKAGIDVRVEGMCYRGVVTLLGTTSDARVRDAAQSTAEKVEGVVRVNNLIQISEVPPKAEVAATAGGNH